MKNKLLFTITFLFAFSLIYSQSEPQDYLSSEFHKDRRDNVRNLMPKNSVAVFFANPVRNRANDVDYHYHQDPNFYYLTGFREPNSVLLIFSEDQNNADDIFEIGVLFFKDGCHVYFSSYNSTLTFRKVYFTDSLTLG